MQSVMRLGVVVVTAIEQGLIMTHFDNIEPPCVIKAHRLNVVMYCTYYQ
jgi:hypothetical protein